MNKLDREHLRSVQDKMKDYKKTAEQKFKMGDKVLILLPKNNHPVKAKFQGPHKIKRKVSEPYR